MMTHDNDSNARKELPTGWRWARLGEVCEQETETLDPTKIPDQEFTYVDISSVDNKGKYVVSPQTLRGAEAPSRARKLIRANDVIVSTTRPNLNAVALIPPDLDGQICSTGFCVLRAKSDIDPHYLFEFTQSQEFVDPLSQKVQGALYPAVTDSDVKNLYIPLPPLATQRAIARRLERDMAEVARLRAAMERQRQAAAALPAAYLREVFESVEAREWPVVRLGDILRLRKDVVHPHDHPTGPAIFVGLEHIETHTGCRIGSLNVDMSALSGRKPRFFQDDIVYGYLRPYLNKVWLAEFDGLCSVDQYVYSVNLERASTQFITAFMRSPIYLKRAPIDTTPGQLPRIRTEEVASVELALPPLSEQYDIVQRLEYDKDKTTQIRNAADRQRAAIDAMTAALLREIFGGFAREEP